MSLTNNLSISRAMSPREGACLTLLVCLLGAAPSLASDRIDVSTYPVEIQERYVVFANRCSKCHSLDRPINAHLTGNEWKNYVRKMIRQPGSGINQENGRIIFEFLKFFTERRAGNAEPNVN